MIARNSQSEVRRRKNRTVRGAGAVKLERNVIASRRSNSQPSAASVASSVSSASATSLWYPRTERESRRLRRPNARANAQVSVGNQHNSRDRWVSPLHRAGHRQRRLEGGAKDGPPEPELGYGRPGGRGRKGTVLSGRNLVRLSWVRPVMRAASMARVPGS